MHSFFVAFCLLPMVISKAQESTTQPIDVVNARNRALNAHDLDAFLATYAEDVVIYVYPSREIGRGKRHIAKIFSPFIDAKDVRTSVKKTMVADGFVVVDSVTTFGKKSEEGVAIYEVRNGLIKTVRFLRDTLRAKQTDANDAN
ncbi:MAG: nuclear transport factor 2 family protein [Aureliella sp.]